MSKAETWLLKNWESNVAKQKKSLYWMKGEYGASDDEVELEAMTNVLTNVIGHGYLDARELGDEDLYRKITQLEEFAKRMEVVPARNSLSVKHTRCSERRNNGQII